MAERAVTRRPDPEPGCGSSTTGRARRRQPVSVKLRWAMNADISVELCRGVHLRDATAVGGTASAPGPPQVEAQRWIPGPTNGRSASTASRSVLKLGTTPSPTPYCTNSEARRREVGPPGRSSPPGRAAAAWPTLAAQRRHPRWLPTARRRRTAATAASGRGCRRCRRRAPAGRRRRAPGIWVIDAAPARRPSTSPGRAAGVSRSGRPSGVPPVAPGPARSRSAM